MRGKHSGHVILAYWRQKFISLVHLHVHSRELLSMPELDPDFATITGKSSILQSDEQLENIQASVLATSTGTPLVCFILSANQKATESN